MASPYEGGSGGGGGGRDVDAHLTAVEAEAAEPEDLAALALALLEQLGDPRAGQGGDCWQQSGSPPQFAEDGSGPTRREVGHEALWTLSSAKMGNGVQQLRDGDLNTFWQSDGQQPHSINIQFHRIAKLQAVALYVDVARDDSYTPQKLSIRLGNSHADLREVAALECQDPQGWIVVNLPVIDPAAAPDHSKSSADPQQPSFLRGRLLQILILSSHQNGRDTHVRQVKVYSPRRPPQPQLGSELEQFSSEYFRSHSRIR